ncbi:hypothetical protein DIPPA_11674 [Diplonema papillatum]|nr:hypothetical protein DIPPA_11674 [Diplonema papillatum]
MKATSDSDRVQDASKNVKEGRKRRSDKIFFEVPPCSRPRSPLSLSFSFSFSLSLFPEPYFNPYPQLEQARDELVAKRAQVERLHAEVNQLYAERDATEEKLALAHAKERQVAQLEAEIADLRDRQLQADTDVEKGMAAIEECSRLRQVCKFLLR